MCMEILKTVECSSAKVYVGENNRLVYKCYSCGSTLMRTLGGYSPGSPVCEIVKCPICGTQQTCIYFPEQKER